MKLEIEMSSTELKRAAAGLAKVMGRSGLPALQCVRMVKDPSGEVTLCATDLDSQATYRLSACQSGSAGEMLVPWELFAKAAKTAKERARFIREKPDTVVVHTFVGSMSFEEPAAMPPLDEWPILLSFTGPWLETKDAFKTAFLQALACASTDSSRFVINGVCLDLSKPDAHYVVATDGRRLYAANSFQFDLPRSVIIPNRKFLAWPGFLEDGDWKLRVKMEPEAKDGGWIEIASASWTLQTKLVGGEYPNWRQIFPAEESPATTVRLTPEAVTMLLEAVPLVRTADPRRDSACLAVQGSTLVLNSRSTLQEAWKETLVPGATASGGPLSVLVNKVQFTQALRMGFNQIEIRDQGCPTVMRAPGKQMALGYVNGDQPGSSSIAESSQPAPQTSTTTTNTTATSESERNTMNTNASTAERPKPTAAPEPPESELRAAMLQVESVRNTFRDSLNGLNQVMNLLKAAEKEQKGSAREIESVRSTLRSLQRVQI